MTADTDTRVVARPVRRVGAYEIVGFLGRGGVADVHLARDASGRRVALKLVRPRQPDDSAPFIREGQERMIVEARAVAAIDHPNVVKLFEIGKLDDGGVFIAMEYLTGMTLREVLDSDGNLSPRVMIRIAIGIARGIGAAHARGIVHRDLKPSNIMVVPLDDDDYIVKIIDFGIAKFLDGSSELTRVGTIPGTPQYLAPELCRGEVFDHRADIYSLGVLMHHASIGGYPVEGTPNEIVALHQRRSVVRTSDSISSELRPIIERCLRSDPAERYQTTDELIRALGDANVEMSTTMVKTRVRSATTQPTLRAVVTAAPTDPESGVVRIDTRRPSERQATSPRLRVTRLQTAIALALVAFGTAGGIALCAREPERTVALALPSVPQPTATSVASPVPEPEPVTRPPTITSEPSAPPRAERTVKRPRRARRAPVEDEVRIDEREPDPPIDSALPSGVLRAPAKPGLATDSAARPEPEAAPPAKHRKPRSYERIVY